MFWHRYPVLSRGYACFAIAFVVVTVASQQVLGECFLTTLARSFWDRAGEARESVPFTVLFVNAVAGIRPSSRVAVLLWEAAVFVSSVGTLWYWYKTEPRARRLRRALGFVRSFLGPSHAGESSRGR